MEKIFLRKRAAENRAPLFLLFLAVFLSFFITTAFTTTAFSYDNNYLRGNININNGALVTSSQSVILNLAAFDPQYAVTETSFSNDGQNWSLWEPYQASKNWLLSNTEGLKTVFVRFKNSAGYIMGSLNRPAVDSIYYTTQTPPQGISSIEVKGRQLLMQRPSSNSGPIPYKIKGICWSPASIGNPGAGDIVSREIEFKNWYKQDIALMKDMGVNTVRTYLDFGTDLLTFSEILDELYRNGIMVIMCVDDSIANSANIDQVVSNFKNHPAILAWQIGNEWNLNFYYLSFINFEDVLNFTEQAAQKIKQLDPYHPVTSILADSIYFTIPKEGEDYGNTVIEYFVAKRCPSIDIWGLNVYRSGSFGGLFYEWGQISPKPMFISEAGTDAYDSRISNENPQMQADFAAGLFDEVYFHFSADRPNEPCLGVSFFELNDEWWKMSSPFTHDASGNYNPYANPDNISNEEYYGLLDINRTKRQAYFTVGDRYKKQGQYVNLPVNLTLTAVSYINAQFFKNGERFYDKIGYASGRGFNFAIIDPKTGLVEEVHNFDSSSDSDALLYLKNFILNIASEKIILASVALDAGLGVPSLYREAAYQAIESLGSNLIRIVNDNDTWAMISIKGRPGNLAEGYNSDNLGELVPTQIEANLTIVLDLDKDGIADNIDIDRDNDGLTDINELAQNTDPLDKDTDDDGKLDSIDSIPLDPVNPEWVLVLPIPWYQEEKSYYSAPASCKMVLDYLSQDATLTQNQLYGYTSIGVNDLTAEQVKSTLNYFKPQVYNFEIISGTNIANALRDIAHWMDYEVPGALIKNIPVVIPTFGRYDNWMVVKGAAASQDPNANQNLFQPANFSVYGFWLNDPAVSGIGENSYKTAAELQNTYYLPMATNDNWNAKYIAVAEPPEEETRAKTSIRRIPLKKLNRKLCSLARKSAEVSPDKELDPAILRQLENFDWKAIIDPVLLKDDEFNAAFNDTRMRRPYKVRILNSKNSFYYLIPFDKIWGKRQLASVALILEGKYLSFKEASWVKKPAPYRILKKSEAIQLAQRKARRYKKIGYNKVSAELVWQPGKVSDSPYKPFWRVRIANQIWFVTADKKVIFGGNKY
ncbi:MAG: interleukin-like EMT inducer domain-containing protein [Candidatus Omnitrophota bacterium]|nr:interleukin-like EMT inducer domain-containing protein [Candidatus Omnitrophota bacterium]